MDLGTLFFGGLSLLALLKKNSKNKTDAEANSSSIQNDDINFVSDEDYQKWLDEKYREEYEAEKAAEAEKEAEKEAEENRKKILGENLLIFNLNNYPNNITKIPSFSTKLYNPLPDTFYDFTSDENLIKMGIKPSDGNYVTPNAVGLDLSNYRIFAECIHYAYSGSVEVVNDDEVIKTSSNVVEVYFLLEIVNPTDRDFIVSKDILINSVKICGKDLFKRGLQVKKWDEVNYTTYSVTPLSKQGNVSDSIVPAKSNKVFFIDLAGLTIPNSNKIEISKNNFSFCIDMVIKEVGIDGNERGRKRIDSCSYWSEKPTIIDNINDTYVSNLDPIITQMSRASNLYLPN